MARYALPALVPAGGYLLTARHGEAVFRRQVLDVGVRMGEAPGGQKGESLSLAGLGREGEQLFATPPPGSPFPPPRPPPPPRALAFGGRMFVR